MAQNTTTEQQTNDATAEELIILEHQIQQVLIRSSEIQKERYRRIRTIAFGQSEGEASGWDFVLGIAVQSLQEELRNTKAAKADLLRVSKRSKDGE